MMKETVGDRLHLAMREAGMTQNQLADQMGVERSVISRAINGVRKISIDELPRLAAALGVRAEWLLTGEPPKTADVVNFPRSDGGHILKVVSYIGAGAEVFPIDDGESLEDVELDFPIPRGAVAAIVRGDSMFPIFEDGDLVAYGGEPLPPEKAVGSTCIVQLSDGRMLIKRVRRGSSPGVYTLTSANAPDIEDVSLEWARAFIMRLSRNFWRRR